MTVLGRCGSNKLLLMFQISRFQSPIPLNVLCIGAHSDDIEIGCSGTLLTLAERGHPLSLDWVVLSANDERANEAKYSAERLLLGVADLRLHLGNFKDSYFPAFFGPLKEHFSELRQRIEPDIIFTHSSVDSHQDHKLVAELTWQTWRDHFILEYEIPKYEGDLGASNFFMPIAREAANRKVEHLCAVFASQRSKSWFTSETFLALMRLRGIQCRSPDGLAEAFVARKILL